MRGKITEEKVVEHLLSEFPIKELLDERQKNALVATLLNGEKRMVEFEKQIVPAEVVDRFVVVEHLFPIPHRPFTKHHNNEIISFNSYPEAQLAFNEKAKEFIDHKNLGYDIHQVVEIFLVGEFKGQKVDFNRNGVLDVNSGIVLHSALSPSNSPLRRLMARNYTPKECRDLEVPFVIGDKLYVKLDRDSASLTFEQNFLSESNKINEEIWKVGPGTHLSAQYTKGAGDDEGALLHKRKNGNEFTTEQWVTDPLISKRQPSGKSNGKGIQ